MKNVRSTNNLFCVHSNTGIHTYMIVMYIDAVHLYMWRYIVWRCNMYIGLCPFYRLNIVSYHEKMWHNDVCIIRCSFVDILMVWACTQMSPSQTAPSCVLGFRAVKDRHEHTLARRKGVCVMVTFARITVRGASLRGVHQHLEKRVIPGVNECVTSTTCWSLRRV